MQGKIVKSLDLLKMCHILDEKNVEVLKQISKTLHLLGKHQAALDITEEALKHDKHDWEIYHLRGKIKLYMKDVDGALEAFERANHINKHESK